MNTPMYEDFLTSDDEIYQFETDMEEGKYKEWVDRFPEHMLSIFGSLLCYYGNQISEEDIIFFVNKGLDLNTISNVFPSDYEGTTALIYAGENRHDYLMQYLIKYGADVNLKDVKGRNALESVFYGHNPYALDRVEETERCVKVLMENGAINMMNFITFLTNILKNPNI